jgi:Cu/Ag efflux protein CusF
MSMKRYPHLALIVGIVAVTNLVCGMAQSQTTTTLAPVTKTAHVLANETVTETATVLHVDQSTRLVTLRDSKGNESTIKAGEHVRNLEKLKEGDEISVRYQQAISMEFFPAGSSEQPGVETQSNIDRADKGQKPGGTGERSVATTATIQAVDLKNYTVTLKGPDGNEHTFVVKDPARQAKLSKLKVGDMVRITYMEALAVQVTPKAK